MTKETQFIFHICTSAEWNTTKERGTYTPASFNDIGFIHCSTPKQILKVANEYYPKSPDLKLIWIDPAKLNTPLKWEESDGGLFPHIYGVLNLPAVTAVYDFLPDNDGVFREIPGVKKHGKGN